MPCPFCMIASGSPPSNDPPIIRSSQGSAYIVLSTPVIVAFLDIAPLSRGHLLVCPRSHAAKATDMTVSESIAVGFWLPVLSRAVMKAVGSSVEESCWNVIQANGAEAGQTVPHSHFHIIPRLGEVRDPSDITDAERKNIALGEGPRVKLEDGDGTELSARIKAEVAKEIRTLKDAGEVLIDEEGGITLIKKGSQLKL